MQAAGVNTAVGASANASGSTGYNVALGTASNASGSSGSSNVAIGSLSVASGNSGHNIAIGGWVGAGITDASGSNSTNIAIGGNANASGANANNIALGTNSVAGNNSVAVGTGASATLSNSAAFGNGATATRANQQAFGTASNTYTMAGITSAGSRAAQSGALQVVTSDGSGNLATSTLAGLGLASTADLAAINGQLNDLAMRSERAYNGIAMAFAMAAVPTVMPGEKLAMTMNYGTFEGSSGVALNAAYRLTDRLQVNAGIGYGVNESIAGGRVGLRIAW
jgi:autotransporter adhesin